MRLMSAAFAVTLAASAAAAAPPAPTWTRAPTVAEVAAAYPAKARAAGVDGDVLLSCTLSPSLAPYDCVALTEAPRGFGFAAAARQLAKGMAAAPGQGISKGVEVHIPVAFRGGQLKAGGPVVRAPHWTALPTADAFQATFPKAENGVNDVRVTLVCAVQAGGALSDCAVDREEPAGAGYGAGALALAPRFRVAPWSADGEPTVGARVRVPIRYQLQPVSAAQR